MFSSASLIIVIDFGSNLYEKRKDRHTQIFPLSMAFIMNVPILAEALRYKSDPVWTIPACPTIQVDAPKSV